MSQQLSFLAPPAPPPAPPYTPTARELESITVAEIMATLLEELGETESAALARTIADQCRATPDHGIWAVGVVDVQMLQQPWVQEDRPGVRARVRDIAAELTALQETRCPKCQSAGVTVYRFGRDERHDEYRATFHMEYRWRCRACGTKWDEHTNALKARMQGGAS